MDDLESVLDDAYGHQLLAVVAAVHHHGVGQTLHDGALGLPETLGGITSSRVWKILGILLFHSNVILQESSGIFNHITFADGVVQVSGVSELVISWAT